jgi:hypothetical protein
MNDTAAPRMIPVEVAVTKAEPQYGPDAWLVQSLNEGDSDPYWTIETPANHLGRYGENLARGIAAQLHLARTRPEYRAARFYFAPKASAELQVETDDFDVRVYRAELRLVAHS